MNWMLDLIRSRQGAGHNVADASRGGPIRHRRRLGIEALEERSLLSISSFFTGLFPTFTSTSTTNATNKQILKKLREPTDVAYPPYDIHLEVSSVSDPGATGQVFSNHFLVDGIAPPYSTVWLAYGPLGYFNTETRADSNGYFLFSASVPAGTTEIRAFSENYAEAYSNIASINVNSANPIVAWDAIALRAIQGSDLTPELASRALAILHTAQYDAVAATSDPKSAFAVQVAAPSDASPVQAVNIASFTVLNSLFPAFAPAFTRAFGASELGLTAGKALTDGASVGLEVAQKTLASRVSDGSTITTATGIAVNPNWGQVRPFVIPSGSSYRPAAPPNLGTTAYDQALTEVTQLGRSNSTVRTADQTAAAEFWDDPLGTSTDVGHWNAIAEEIATARKTNLLVTARTFAMLDVAMADAAIAADDAKSAYISFRPITVIRTTDLTWNPLLVTPTTPSYVSEHAAFGAAASDILSAVYGNAMPFTTSATAAAIPAATPRTFASFAAAATEDANSRIDGGVNFRFDTTAGSAVGDSVGKAVLAKFPKQ